MCTVMHVLVVSTVRCKDSWNCCICIFLYVCFHRRYYLLTAMMLQTRPLQYYSVKCSGIFFGLYLAVYFFKWQMSNQMGASLDEPFDCSSLHQNILYTVYSFSEFVVVNIKQVLSIVCPLWSNFAWENIFWEYMSLPYSRNMYSTSNGKEVN